MKRFASVLTIILVALVSFLAGVYFFFPRDTAAGYLWRKGVLAAAEKGVTLEAATLGVEGYFPFRILLRNTRVVAPVLSAEAGVVEIVPLFLDSLLSLAPTAELRLERVSLNLPLPGQQPVYLSFFSSKAALRPSGTEVSSIRSSGDLVMEGRLKMNSRTGMPEEADLSIGGDRAALIEYVKGMLPFSKDASGAWTLKMRGGGN
jgi:hypothetical protein